ncbi:hypothetical protein DPMN_040144 [Dreissena polymorpha]|uniref:Uncharacterized protein n=1 Tax=Dreissena polymorpha TaxID=45954 RepID=A0A9D4CUI0_DREPO|nr:hypothetical protein DPMN_040144 [Dreissena polymorpha]
MSGYNLQLRRDVRKIHPPRMLPSKFTYNIANINVHVPMDGKQSQSEKRIDKVIKEN